MKTILTASMMCADFGHLDEQMKLLTEAKVDAFHIDIMDGNYVPNLGMGLQDCEYICKHSEIMTDVHLMIEKPSRYIDKFCKMKPTIIYVHSDSEDNIRETLQTIRKSGVKSGLAISPDVTLAEVEPLFDVCDYLLVMTVYPGFAGAKYQDFVDEKLDKICKLKEKYGYTVIIDGHCAPDVIKTKIPMGVDGFVLGTSALFNKGREYKEIVPELRNL